MKYFQYRPLGKFPLLNIPGRDIIRVNFSILPKKVREAGFPRGAHTFGSGRRKPVFLLKIERHDGLFYFEVLDSFSSSSRDNRVFNQFGKRKKSSSKGWQHKPSAPAKLQSYGSSISTTPEGELSFESNPRLFDFWGFHVVATCVFLLCHRFLSFPSLKVTAFSDLFWRSLGFSIILLLSAIFTSFQIFSLRTNHFFIYIFFLVEFPDHFFDCYLMNCWAL